MLDVPWWYSTTAHPGQPAKRGEKADRYEPVLNESYQVLAEHNGTVILPSRPREPKDKLKAENGVLIVARWLLARIRNETCHTLRGQNNRLRELLADLNNRPMKG